MQFYSYRSFTVSTTSFHTKYFIMLLVSVQAIPVPLTPYSGHKKFCVRTLTQWKDAMICRAWGRQQGECCQYKPQTIKTTATTTTKKPRMQALLLMLVHCDCKYTFSKQQILALRPYSRILADIMQMTTLSQTLTLQLLFGKNCSLLQNLLKPLNSFIPYVAKG